MEICAAGSHMTHDSQLGVTGSFSVLFVDVFKASFYKSDQSIHSRALNGRGLPS